MLRDCLQSVYAHMAGIDGEVFVVDNGSIDGSAKMVAREFPTVRLMCNKENRGFAAANNQALRIAKGRYVLLLNSDTLVRDGVFKQSFDYMENHDEVGVLGCRVLNTDESLQLTCSQFPSLSNLILLSSGLFKLPWPLFLGRYQMTSWERDDERNVDVVSGCYMFVRSTAMSEVGLLDESFYFFGEETDWCRRFTDSGWHVRFAPVGTIIHFGSGSSRKLRHKRDLMLTSGTVRLHRKHGGVPRALSAWMILLVFNSSRAIYWSLRSLTAFHRQSQAHERRQHFINVVKGFVGAWPRFEGKTHDA